MAEVKWFKVLTDMFSDDKIKIIQSMPEGDSLIVMWFKVLAQAGKTNDGGYIYLKKNIPYTAGMLSTLFNKPQQIVELALRTFSEFGMIDMDERGYIFITNWEKHQNIEGMDKVREQTRIRNTRYREKKRLELMDSDVTRDVTVTQDDAIEEEREVDLERDTTLLVDSFEKVKEVYVNLHKSLDFPYKDAPLLSRLLREGFSPELINGIMRDKYKPSITTFSYYEGAIRDTVKTGSLRSKGKGKDKAARMVDPELEFRRREIALNRWIQEGNNPDDFEFGFASNH